MTFGLYLPRRTSNHTDRRATDTDLRKVGTQRGRRSGRQPQGDNRERWSTTVDRVYEGPDRLRLTADVRTEETLKIGRLRDGQRRTGRMALVFRLDRGEQRRSKNIAIFLLLILPPHFRCPNHPFHPHPSTPSSSPRICCASSPTTSSSVSPWSSPSPTRPQTHTTSYPSSRHVDTSTTPSQNRSTTTSTPASSRQSSIPPLPSVVSAHPPSIPQTSPTNSSGTAAS